MRYKCATNLRISYLCAQCTGKPLFGKEGALEPMLERILNAALEGEMDAHPSEESRENGNRRNGKMSKTVQTQYGEMTDTALEKLVYLAYRNISEKWSMPLANWALISQQLSIKIGDKFEIL